MKTSYGRIDRKRFFCLNFVRHRRGKDDPPRERLREYAVDTQLNEFLNFRYTPGVIP